MKKEYKKQSRKEKAEPKINKIMQIEVDKLNIDLMGVTIINDKPRLVKNAIPYELVEAEEIYYNGIGKIYNPIKIIEPSEFRVEPGCKYYENCGNCNLLHMQYKRQCKEKVIMLKKYLHGVCDIFIDDCVQSPDVEWRNKVHLVFSKHGKLLHPYEQLQPLFLRQ